MKPRAVITARGTGGEMLNLPLMVNSLEWAAIGGPSRASISIQGGRLELWEAIELLRCKVEVWDERGRLIWYGYVSETTVRDGVLEMGATLASMFNKVAVAYSYVEPGTQSVGVRKTTAWASDAESIAEYGTKELLSSQDGLSDAAAVGRRDAILAAYRWPGGVANPTGDLLPRGRAHYSGAMDSKSANLVCEGWWNTLDWLYAPVTGVSSVETTTQISSLITSYGQFMVGTVIEYASGLSSTQYRDGSKTAREEVEALLASGTTEGRRLLATLDGNRRARVFAEPDITQMRYTLNRRGEVFEQNGSEAQPAEMAGNWVHLADVVPLTADISRMINPTIQFVDGVTWSASGVRLRFRGQPSIEDMFKVGRA